MRRLYYFSRLVFRRDPQYGWIGLSLAWKLSGILAAHENDWRIIS